MNETLAFLVRHGALILFVIVFIEQIGFPLPAIPFLLAAGALVATGEMHWAVMLGSAALGGLLADLIWYELGRIYGTRVLGLLCRISLEPDSCVRSTQDTFSRYGMSAIVGASFVPGLSTVMPPLAAIFHVPIRRFLFFDGLGSLLYPAVIGGLGFIFSHQLLGILHALGQIVHSAIVVLVALLGAYIGYKYFQRQRLLRKLRVARISVDELHRKLEAGEDLLVVDLRSAADLRNDPFIIKGALHVHLHELERRHMEIPRDRDIVLYCSCPNEVTSARTALLLRKRGITRVRPLGGGINGHADLVEAGLHNRRNLRSPWVVSLIGMES
jgi:membrane protein DedA with SNARE-associated domain/rhodanese-related sulfurtransferase